MKEAKAQTKVVLRLFFYQLFIKFAFKLKKVNNEFLQTEEAIVAMLKTVYDPEIPVNVFDLGLIYKVDIDDEKNVRIDMT